MRPQKKAKRLAILGATGSVGAQALEVFKSYPQGFDLVGMSACKSWERLASLSEALEPDWVFLADPSARGCLRKTLANTGVIVLEDELALLDTLSPDALDLVLACASGTDALKPTLAALERGIDVGLANKEAMLVLGPLLKKAAKGSGARIFPMDSEHAAVERALRGVRSRKEVRKVILTSSGGPFWKLPEEAIKHVSREEVLKHPVWSMGSKITVDSATLMNKGFELIEACLLFDIPMEKLEVWIHPQGLVHGILELNDGQHVWIVSEPDMRIPIAQAMFFPWVPPTPLRSFRPFGREFAFFMPDDARFPALKLAREAFSSSRASVVRLVAANEVLVEAFLHGNLPFWRIVPLLEEFAASSQDEAAPGLSDLSSTLAFLGVTKDAAYTLLNQD